MTSNELLDALVVALNERFPDGGFQKRLFSSRTSTETGAATRRYVEPGQFRIERETRSAPRRFQRFRIVSEGFPTSESALEAAILAERDFLETLAVDSVKNPKIVPNAHCLSANAFADAPPLYDPAAAENETPYLFGGVELEFFWL